MIVERAFLFPEFNDLLDNGIQILYIRLIFQLIRLVFLKMLFFFILVCFQALVSFIWT